MTVAYYDGLPTLTSPVFPSLSSRWWEVSILTFDTWIIDSLIQGSPDCPSSFEQMSGSHETALVHDPGKNDVSIQVKTFEYSDNLPHGFEMHQEKDYFSRLYIFLGASTRHTESGIGSAPSSI